MEGNDLCRADKEVIKLGIQERVETHSVTQTELNSLTHSHIGVYRLGGKE